MSLNEHYKIIENIILQRKTTKVPKMNGAEVAPELIDQLLHLADSAPSHGMTEPWRFYIYSGKGLEKFCTDHAEMYWEHTAEDKRNELSRKKYSSLHKFASHLIVVVMKRSEKGKIPHSEEYSATCAAIQNILIGAEAMGLASIWNTGGMSTKPPMKKYLNLGEQDEVVGWVYIGHRDIEQQKPQRRIPLSEKTQYFN